MTTPLPAPRPSDRSFPTREEIATLLHACSNGSGAAFDELFAVLYDELRLIARRHLRELGRGNGGGTLNTTALVHESYLKLAGGARPAGRERAQFFAVASKAMRHILVDYERRRCAAKRGGGRICITLEESAAATPGRTSELLALDLALDRLAARAPRLEQVVECRFFGGLSVEETAEVLGVSNRTVERDWSRARTYLYQMLAPEGS